MKNLKSNIIQIIILVTFSIGMMIIAYFYYHLHPNILPHTHLKVAITNDSITSPIVYEEMKNFCKEVDSLTSHNVSIELIPVYDEEDSLKFLKYSELYQQLKSGKYDAIHCPAYYAKADSSKKYDFADFFSAIPFGMSYYEAEDWVSTPNVQRYWQLFYKKDSLIPFACGQSGPQWAGFFSKEINDTSDFRGMRMRTSYAKLTIQVYRALGITIKDIPLKKMREAMENDSLDAYEWLGPATDCSQAIRLDSVKCKEVLYYYREGWQEPNTLFALFFRSEKYQNLNQHAKNVITALCNKYTQKIGKEFMTANKQKEKELLIKADKKLIIKADTILRIKADTILRIKSLPPIVLAQIKQLALLHTKAMIAQHKDDTLFMKLVKDWLKYHDTYGSDTLNWQKKFQL